MKLSFNNTEDYIKFISSSKEDLIKYLDENISIRDSAWSMLDFEIQDTNYFTEEKLLAYLKVASICSFDNSSLGLLEDKFLSNYVRSYNKKSKILDNEKLNIRIINILKRDSRGYWGGYRALPTTKVGASDIFKNMKLSAEAYLENIDFLGTYYSELKRNSPELETDETKLANLVNDVNSKKKVTLYNAKRKISKNIETYPIKDIAKYSNRIDWGHLNDAIVVPYLIEQLKNMDETIFDNISWDFDSYLTKIFTKKDPDCRSIFENYIRHDLKSILSSKEFDGFNLYSAIREYTLRGRRWTDAKITVEKMIELLSELYPFFNKYKEPLSVIFSAGFIETYYKKSYLYINNDDSSGFLDIRKEEDLITLINQFNSK